MYSKNIFITKIEDMQAQCMNGNIPHQISLNHLRTICINHMNKKFCDSINPRRVMRCITNGASINKQFFSLDILIEIPRTLQEEYKLYKVTSIPIFKSIQTQNIDLANEQVNSTTINKSNIIEEFLRARPISNTIFKL